MSSHALTWTLLHRRSARAFFLAQSTRHVRSVAVAAEVARAVAALAGLAAWAGVGLLLVG